MDETVLFIILFGVGIWSLLCLAGSGTQNYCHYIREPRADDDDLYPDLYPECKEDQE